MRSRTHNPAAFTLIELVLALTMVAILAVSLSETLRLAYRSSQAAEAIIQPARTGDIAMELLGNDLQNAVMPAIGTDAPYTSTFTGDDADTLYDIMGANTASGITLGANSSTVSGSASSSSSSSSNGQSPMCLAGPFEGTQGTSTGPGEIDDLYLFTTADGPDNEPGPGEGEIKMVELTVAQPPGSNQLCLVRRVWPNLLPASAQQQDVTQPTEEVLCRDVTGVTFQYYDGSQWNPSWDSTQEDNDLPAAVQVVLSFQRPLADGSLKTFSFTRVFNLANSTAALDPEVNEALSQ